MEAIQTVLNQIEAARAKEDIPFEAESHSTLGNLYFEGEKWDEALAAYQQAMTLFEQASDPVRVAGAQVSMADVHAAKSEWDQAIALCEQARDTMLEAGDEMGLARTLTNLGILYWQTGEWRMTLGCYEKRLDILERLGEPHEIADVSANLGMLYMVFGHKQNASYYLAHAHMVAKRADESSLVERTAEQLVNVLGDAETANAYLTHFKANEELMGPAEPEKQGEALDGLLSAVSAAIAGDEELREQLKLYTTELATDEGQDEETRALNRLLGRVLDGETAVDVSSIAAHLRAPILKWSDTLRENS